MDSGQHEYDIRRLIEKMREAAHEEGIKEEADAWERMEYVIGLKASDERRLLLNVWSPDYDHEVKEHFVEVSLDEIVTEEITGYFRQSPPGKDPECDEIMQRQAEIYAESFERAAKKFRDVAAKFAPKG